MTWKYLPGELPKPGKFVNIAYASREGAVSVIGGARYDEQRWFVPDPPGMSCGCPLIPERVIAWHDAPTWPPK